MCKNNKNCKECAKKGCNGTFIYDKVTIGTKKYTPEGFLVVKAKLARSGIQQYKANEINFPSKNPNDIIQVWRPEKEVFKDEAITSFEAKPVTNDHPPELVNIDNIKKYQVGYVTKNIEKDENGLITELIITDKKAIEDIERGKVEISNGYTANYEFKDGVLDNGAKYQAIQRDIIGNHVAIVQQGRCGSECRIFDEAKVSENTKEIIMIDEDNIIEVDSKDAGNVKKLKDALKAKDEEINKLKEKMSAINDEMEEMRNKKKEEDEKHDKEGKTNDSAIDIDSEVEKRIEIIDSAKKLISNYDYKGKSNLDIKTDVIKQHSPTVMLDGKTEHYIDARYDIIKENLKDKVAHIAKTEDAIVSQTMQAPVNGNYRQRYLDRQNLGAS